MTTLKEALDQLAKGHELDNEQKKLIMDKWQKELGIQPCEDAISRQAVISAIDEREDVNGNVNAEDIRTDIVLMPSVQPKPKTGHWIAYEVRLPDRTILNYRCSVCGRKLIGYNTETLSEAPFCHCGCRMIEPQESEG